MFRIFQEERVITACMLSFFAVSILVRLFLGWVYRSMIREADNMAATENKLLKQCKLKFANCYELNNGVANIPVFVDKFLNRLSFGPISFETLYHLSGQAMLLSVVCAGIGVCKSIVEGRMLGEILPFYIVSFIGLYLYFSVSTVMDIKGKKRILKVNLVDYLESIDIVRKVNKSEMIADMLTGFNRLVSYVSVAVIGLLLAVAVFLISNTVAIGISVRREEIAIMRLIGAKNSFIKAPFLIEGMVIGVVGAALPLIALFFLYGHLVVYIADRFNILTGVMQFLPAGELFQVLIPVGLILGVGIGLFGSIFTMRRHLKV